MKCYKCRAEVPEGAKFCPKCGAEQGFSEELIKRAADGEQEAITELYNRTYNNVYFTVKALIKDEDTALDIIQDSYVKAFKNLYQLQDSGKFRAWVKRICHNHAVDYLRKTKPVMFSAMSADDEKAVEFEDDRTENLPEQVMEQRETSRLIQEILDSLSDEQRAVVGMFYYEQLSVKEIAQTLSLSENTVKSRLNYARKKIEERVLKLEKEQGIRLHSLAPVPFLLWLFKSQDAQAAEAPGWEMLSAIQEECAKYSGGSMSALREEAAQSPGTGADGTLNTGAGEAFEASRAVKAGSAAVKTAAGAAGKGLAVKVIAGIAAASLLGGTAAGIYAFNKKESPGEAAEIARVMQEENTREENTQEENEKEEEQEIQVSSGEVYQDILDEYGMAMGEEVYNEYAGYPNVNELMLQYYYQYGGDDGVYFTGFYYTYYDIDGNGTDELLIGYGSKFKNVVDVYGIKDNQPYKLFDDEEYPLGDRSQLYIYPDGTMIIAGSGGFENLGVDTFHFEEDGESLSVESQIYEGEYDLESILAEKSGNQQYIERFDWKQIDTKWEELKVGDAKKYIGKYMNGQDWNAGTLTIEENDDDTVKVRLEAFRRKSDQELSTIFEGIGYETNGGLIVDVSGRQVKIKDGMELTLEPAASLKEEWNLDTYVYSEGYVYVGEAGP